MDYSSKPYIINMVYRMIPFLYELNCLIDWSVTETSCDIWNYMRVEEIRNTMFIGKYKVGLVRSFHLVALHAEGLAEEQGRGARPHREADLGLQHDLPNRSAAAASSDALLVRFVGSGIEPREIRLDGRELGDHGRAAQPLLLLAQCGHRSGEPNGILSLAGHVQRSALRIGFIRSRRKDGSAAQMDHRIADRQHSLDRTARSPF